MVHILNTNLNITLNTNDISAVHRLPKHHATSAVTGTDATSSTHPKPAPILIQLSNKKTRSLILSKRKDLKGKGFSITEHLTLRKSLLLRQATDAVKAKKIQSAWSHEGKVIIRTLNNRTTVLSAREELDQY